MTRNRAGRHRRPREGGGPLAHAVGALLTLALLVPATALLVTRARALLGLEESGAAPGCSGADVLGPVLHAGVPVVLLVMVLPIALLSLARRARGWIWLLAALVATVALEAALRLGLPACL